MGARIPIGITREGDKVTTIWCLICLKFATDRSSLVSMKVKMKLKDGIYFELK